MISIIHADLMFQTQINQISYVLHTSFPHRSRGGKLSYCNVGHEAVSLAPDGERAPAINGHVNDRLQGETTQDHIAQAGVGHAKVAPSSKMVQLLFWELTNICRF